MRLVLSEDITREENVSNIEISTRTSRSRTTRGIVVITVAAAAFLDEGPAAVEDPPSCRGDWWIAGGAEVERSAGDEVGLVGTMVICC